MNPLGIVNLVTGVQEWMLDSAASLASPCWNAATVESPRCFEENAPVRSIRGSGWSTEFFALGDRNSSPSAPGK